MNEKPATFVFPSLVTAVLFSILCACCSSGSPAADERVAKGDSRTLTLAAYTTPREVYGKKIIPAFKRMWKAKTGETVEFRESYLGSGAQSRAVIAGFEADVVALSLEPDVNRLADAGLITHEWKAGPGGGMVSRSVVVFGVRKGNPRGIAGWDDLAGKGLKVLTPNVKTSGGAMWNIAAVYGAAMRGQTSSPKNDEAAAQEILARILANVSIMDKGARESMLTYEHGVGDVIITYENEMRVAASTGRDEEYVVPPSTILIENPAAVVDRYADKHGVKDLAEAFVEFLSTSQAQQYYIEYGLRPAIDGIESDDLAGFPKLQDVFSISDLGGWGAVTPKLFGNGGLYDKAIFRAGKMK